VHERAELRVPSWICQDVEQLLADVGETLPGPLPLCPVLLVARAFVIVVRFVASAFRLGPLLFFKVVGRGILGDAGEPTATCPSTSTSLSHTVGATQSKTLLTRTLHKEGKYTDFDDGIGFILPTTAAINKKNDRLLKQIADVTTKRGLYREMRNQITTALLNLTGNGLTWVSS
jgi:hypothetical protein